MSKPIKHGKKWQIRWMDETGKRQSETWPTYEDAEYALDARKIEVLQIRRGLRVRPSASRGFDELCDKWVETRTVRKRNDKDDISIIKVHLRPAFGHLTVDQVTAERIALFSAEVSAIRAANTVRKILSLLDAILNQAVEWGWLDKTPKVRLPRVRVFDRDYKWLRTTEEREHFLLAAKAHKSPTVHPMYATAVFTGMRAGELAGLRWEDINFECRLITVQRSYEGPTKAGDVRYVPILDPLLPILQEWKLESRSKRIVFPNGAGKMWDPRGRVFKSMLAKVLQLGGFPSQHITFHSLRHTFASHWVINGGDLYKLQKVLGHHDSKMTQRYAHLTPTAFEEDWGRLGSAREKAEATIIKFPQTGD